MSKKQNNKKGFTIIEVVLVLAIAGLIFMMVFLALPALQRNQRDTQRKNDLSRVIAAVNNYTAGNRGSIPDLSTGAASFLGSYLSAASDSFLDPLGMASGQTAYTIGASPVETYIFTSRTTTLAGSSASANQNVIYFSSGYVCGSDGTVVSGGTRKIAFRIVLESGGVACQNN